MRQNRRALIGKLPSVAKKILNALTGIGLVLFLVVHLLGNLTLFSSDPGPFNSYAKTLHDLGWLLTAIEIALLLLFAAHIASSIIITRANRKARNEGYAAQAKGRASATKPVASRNMIYSGIILGAFVVWHVISFRFGPGIAEGYVTEINGVASRDLYAVVYEFFENPLNVLLYTAVMIFPRASPAPRILERLSVSGRHKEKIHAACNRGGLCGRGHSVRRISADTVVDILCGARRVKGIVS